MSVNQSNNRIAKNTVFLYIRMFIVLLVSLYTTRAILNALDVVDYGIYNVVAGFVTMFSFLNSSMTSAVQRFYNYEKGAVSGLPLSIVFTSSFIVQLIIILITFVLLESFGLWYINNVMVVPDDRLFAANWVFQFASLSLVMVILQIPYNSAVMAFERMDYYALVSIIDVILKLIIALTIEYFQKDKLIIYAGLMFLISFLNFFMYFIYTKKNIKEIKFNKNINKDLLLKMASFSGWNAIETLAFTIQSQGLNMLINAFAGPIVNAARGVAFQVQNALQGFSANIVAAFKPQLVESYAQNNYQRVKKLMFGQTKICYFLLFLICVPVILERNYILNLWLNNNVPDYTPYFTVLVLLNMVLGCINAPLTQVALAVGKIKTFQIYRSLTISLVLPVSWFLLYEGMNVATVFWISIFATIINQFVSMHLLRKIFYFRYKEYIVEVVKPITIYSFIVILLPIIVVRNLDQTFCRVIVVGFASLLGAMKTYFLGVFNTEEKNLVYNFIGKFLRKSK